MHTTVTKAMSWLKKLLAILLVVVSGGQTNLRTKRLLISGYARVQQVCTLFSNLLMIQQIARVCKPVDTCIVPLASSHCSLIFLEWVCTWDYVLQLVPVTKKVTYTLYYTIHCLLLLVHHFEMTNMQLKFIIFAGAYIVSTLLWSPLVSVLTFLVCNIVLYFSCICYFDIITMII